MTTAIIIPARMQSTRLPGKPLIKFNDGRTLLQHTYQSACAVNAGRVEIATNDDEIIAHCRACKLEYVVADGATGTERVLVAAERLKLSGDDVVVNLQVDEPVSSSVAFRFAVMSQRHCNSPDHTIYTLIGGMKATEKELNCRDSVKVVWSKHGCHWFSRAPMLGAHVHVGVYFFTMNGLRHYARTTSIHSSLESLEQLGWIVAGARILPIAVDGMYAINTQADVDAYNLILEEQAKDRKC